MSVIIKIISPAIEASNNGWLSNDEQFFLLKGVSMQFDAPAYRDEAFSLLSRMQTSPLHTNGCRMYYHYLVAKYHRLVFEETKEFQLIEQAESSIQKVFDISREHGVNIHSPKYYFARAYIKFQVTKHIDHSKRKQKHFEFLDALLDLTSRFSNSTTNWLNKEVRTFALTNDLPLPR